MGGGGGLEGLAQMGGQLRVGRFSLVGGGLEGLAQMRGS